MSFVLRDARAIDAPEIATVFALSCTRAYQGIFPPVLLAEYTPGRQLRRWADHLESATADSCVLVAALQAQVIGFIEVGPASEAPGFGEIHYLFVHPEHARCGAGSRLLREGETCLAGDGYRKALLWVFRDNALAQGFYERAGWQHAGIERAEPSLLKRDYPITECQYSKALARPEPGVGCS